MMQRKYMQDKGFHVKADEDMSELEETKSFDNIDANNVGESYDREMIKEPDAFWALGSRFARSRAGRRAR